jgi:hypothetical protein
LSAQFIFIYFFKAISIYMNKHENILHKIWCYYAVYYKMPVLLNLHKHYAHIIDDRKLNSVKVGRPVVALSWHKLYENPAVCSKVIAGA